MGRGHRSQSIKWIRCSQMPQDLTPTMKRGANRPLDPDFSPYTPAPTSRPTQTHYSQHNTDAFRYFKHSIFHSVALSPFITSHSTRDTGGIVPRAVMSPLWYTSKCTNTLYTNAWGNRNSLQTTQGSEYEFSRWYSLIYRHQQAIRAQKVYKHI